MKVQSFEEFAAEHGASLSSIGDAGLHMSRASISQKAWMRKVNAQARRDAVLCDRRAALRMEYDHLVSQGAIRPPTSLERLQAAAGGHPDNPSTQAAINVLKKREARMRASALKKCRECDAVAEQSGLCPGCEAYREHQS